MWFGLEIDVVGLPPLVCLFVTDNRQIVWADRAQVFCGISHDHMKARICRSEKIKNKNHEKIDKILTPKSWNRIWARSVLEAMVTFINYKRLPC